MKNEMDNQQLFTCKKIKEKFKKVYECNKYAVSNKGTVLNLITGQTLKPRLLQGYKRVSLHYNGKPHDRRIHRLVGEVFIPNPFNKPEINHKDGIRGNNCVNNLEWVTSKENNLHKTRVLGVGDKFKGSRNGNSKLTERDIRIIRNSTKFNNRELALLFDVSVTQINRIKNFKLWKHINSSTTIERT